MTVDSDELGKLVEAELDRAQADMASALKQAKDLVGRMEGYLDDTENKVKGFLEDHKHEVTLLSKPKWMADNGQVPKDLFDPTSFRGHTLIESMLNKEAA